ncbi:MAG: carbonic anhydrase [Verrucomicrobia bacterium]|nr:carbonic anhydrase [Verrucomicrobiota bacterium]
MNGVFRVFRSGFTACVAYSLLGSLALRADSGLGAAAQSPAAVRKSADQTLTLIREASLALLKEGNHRYVTGQPRHPNQDADRRSITVAEGQKPFATILACSDSRSPVEVIFDRGIGELFVVRVAGNVADDTQLGTIEYGVTHLGTPLLVVLGHTGCGAVSAACQGGELHGHLPSLVRRIQPAVTKARAAGTHPDRLLSASIQANVWQQIEVVVKESSVLRAAVKDGSLQVVGGIYDLEKGAITWLGSHPRESELIASADTAEKAAALASAAAAQPARPVTPQTAGHGEAHADHSGHEATPSAQGTGHGNHGSAHPAPGSSGGYPASLLPSHDVKARGRKAPEPAAPGHH